MSSTTYSVPRPFKRLLATEARLLMREPVLLFWGVVFPVLLTVVFGLATNHHPDKKLGGLRLIDVYVPVMMAFVLTILAVQALPSAIANYRERGVLRRMSTTPVSPTALLGANVVVNAVVILIALALITTIAKVAFAVTLPRQLLGFAVALVLGAVAMLALGALVAAVASGARMAGAIGTLLFFPMMFFAGLWVPRELMSNGLQEISNYTPLGATVAAIQDTMHGSWPHASHLIVLAVYAVGLSLAASRVFRWE